MTVEIVAVDGGQRRRWSELFEGYADFYGRSADEAHQEAVWGWLMDPAHELEGYLALVDGRAMGLVHVRRMASPLRGADIGFLDDLFVDPAARGQGLARVLLVFLADLARARGWAVVRWITADDNYPARALYDRVASKTAWNLYEMKTAA